MKSSGSTAFCLLSCLVLFACGGDSAAPIPLEELPGRLTDLVCQSSIDCGLFPDHATCVASLTPSFGQLTADTHAGRIKYDAAAAGACVAFLDSSEGLHNCSFTQRYNLKIPAACASTFVGTLADGASCFVNEACLSGRCDQLGCNGGNSCCAGACAASLTVAPVALGGDCADGRRCVDGASCRGDGLTATCQGRANIGESCIEAGDCVATATCRRPLGGGTGVCAKPAREGDACDGFPRACDLFTDFCDSSSFTCRHKAAVGQTCLSDDGCPAYARCDRATSTCQTRGKVGDPCADLIADCIEGLDCVGGACAAATPNPVCP